MILDKAENEQVAASIILDQFYKNPELPAPAQPQVVARALQLGVEEKALGLAEMKDDELDPHRLKYGGNIALDSITFEAGLYAVSPQKAEALLAKIPKPSPLPGLDEGDGDDVKPPIGDPTPSGPPPPPPPPATDKYRRVRLVITGIPAGKIADVNRGIFMPLKQSAGEFEFTLDIDVASTEGISKATLENKIAVSHRDERRWTMDEGQYHPV